MAETNPAFYGLKIKWGNNDAAAFMAGTRTRFYGTDPIDSLSTAANSDPERFPLEDAIEAAAFLRSQQFVPEQPEQPAPQAGPVYDCATGKCSDGSEPSSNPLFNNPAIRYLACTLGMDIYKRSICQTAAQQIDNARRGTEDAVKGTVLDPAFLDLKAKQLALIVLAVVLIGVAVYAAVK